MLCSSTKYQFINTIGCSFHEWCRVYDKIPFQWLNSSINNPAKGKEFIVFKGEVHESFYCTWFPPPLFSQHGVREWKNIINSLGFLKPWPKKNLAQTGLSPSTKIKFQRHLKEDLNLSLWETISTIEMFVLLQINDLIYHLVRNGWLHSFRTW